MAQKTLNKFAPGHRLALLNYYGFSNVWPIDSGVLHLLGDGSVGDPDHMLDLIRNADQTMQFKAKLGVQDIYWAEVIRIIAGAETRFVYRHVTPEQAAEFVPWGDGFGAQELTQATATAYVQNNGPWYSYETDELLDLPSFARFAGYPGSIGGVAFAQPYSHWDTNFHYWQPYQGSVYFTCFGAGNYYRAWRPFRTTVKFGDNRPDRVLIEPGWTLTDSLWGTTVIPWNAATVQHYSDPVNIDMDEWTVEPAPWTNPHPDDEVTIEPMPYFLSTRFMQLRILDDDDGLLLYEGTRGGFVNLNVSSGTATIEKLRPNGNASAAGSVPIMTASMTTREDSVRGRIYGLGWMNGLSPNILNAAAAPQAIPLNARDFIPHDEHDIPYWARIVPIELDGLQNEARFCAFIRRDHQAVYAGWGAVSYGYFEGDETPEEPLALHPVFEDQMLLRLPASLETELLAAAHENDCSMPDPPAGWVAVRPNPEVDPVAWARTEATPMRFTALLSDDGDFHDPRVNTATSAMTAFLAAGDGLCYEGPLGAIPRPRSGATGTLLGRAITGSADFALDVMPLPTGGHMAVMVMNGIVSAWVHDGSTAELVWNRSLAESIPPGVLSALGGVTPAFDLRFMHPAWPTPSGVLTIGEWSLVVVPRDASHVGYEWTVAGVGRVSPPFVVTLGWPASERFPDPDPRSPAQYVSV